jgi:amino acid transporter
MSVEGRHLRRVLSRWDLIVYGVILLQPTAPLSVYGVISGRAHGHVVTTILLALVGMLFTAMSYGRMAQAYPSAGSAFTYVSRELNPVLGYATGWGMLIDYMVNPLIVIVWCSKAAMSFVPQIPYPVWALVFFALFTTLNLLGIKSSARISGVLTAALSAVVLVFVITATRYVLHHDHSAPGFFSHPFFDPSTFKLSAVLGGTSIAVLTYIGFDGISTLSEEVENPRRNILFATVAACLLISVLSAIEVYLGQLVWPASQPFRDADTAFVDVAARTAGAWFFVVMNLTLLVANFGTGLGAQLGAARLLYGMGRSKALPASFFAAVDARHGIPRNNVILVGVAALLGAFFISYGLGAQILNFGALLAYMAVNLAALVRYYLRATVRRARDLWPPLVGFLTCLLLWLSLSRAAKTVGVIWLAIGMAYGAWRTRGFRSGALEFECADDPPLEEASPAPGAAVMHAMRR